MIRAPRAPSRLAGLVGLGAGLLAILLPGAAQAANDEYVAMGDSYSSGTGTGDYFDANCERSDFAYHRLLDGSLPGAPTAAVVACGGATTNSVLNSGQHGNPAQGNDPALGANTDYVTISIGGNDAGFSSVLLECGQPSWISDCDQAVDGAQNTISNTLPGRLDNVYDRIRSKAPNARVTVVGYPRIFKSPGEDCNAATFFDGGEMSRLNQTADLLADVTRAQAQANGFGFADARGAFIGHAVCDDEWLNGLSNPTGESFHPNKKGHDLGYEGIVGSALRSQESPVEVRGPNGRIAFTRGSDVYAINGNGAFPVNLPSNSTAADTDPAYSPDGTKIAFASDRDGDNEIYVAAWDGSGTVTKLTSNTSDDREPAWSPNGGYIAFRSNRDGNNDIYKMTATGASQQRLTANGDSEFAPAWSPDGAEIAYQRFGSQNDVWKMNSDGQGQTQLTTDGANDGAPEYSPNGTQIAFHSNRGGSDFEIFTMSATGGSQTAANQQRRQRRTPDWSPNGGSIAFSSDRDGDHEIYTMTSTGGSQTRRTTLSGTDISPSWQGDKTPPATTLARRSAGRDQHLDADVHVLADEQGSTFECKVDSGSFAACSSPNQTRCSSEGAHTFQVRAIDPSGNVDGSPAQRAITIEAPIQTAITSGPSGPINETTATFEFDAADPNTAFSCSVDDVIVEDPCASPFTTGRARRRAALVQRHGKRRRQHLGGLERLRRRHVAPDTSLVSGPGAVTNQIRPSFELAAEEGSSFECRIGSDPFEPCTSPFAPGADLPDGDHTFEARATDPAGNAEVDSARRRLRGRHDRAGCRNRRRPSGGDRPAGRADRDRRQPASLQLLLGRRRCNLRVPTRLARRVRLGRVRVAVRRRPARSRTVATSSRSARSIRRATPASPRAGASSSTRRPPRRRSPTGPPRGAPSRTRPSSSRPMTPMRRSSAASTGRPATGSSASPGSSSRTSAKDHTDSRCAPSTSSATGWNPGGAGVHDRPNGAGTTLDAGAERVRPTTRPHLRLHRGRRSDAASSAASTAAPSRPASLRQTLTEQADGPHTFEVRGIDAAGNADEPVLRNIRVDTVDPVLTITGPAVTNDTTPTFDLTANEALGAWGSTARSTARRSTATTR